MIYLDVVFFTDFFFNVLVLSLAGAILKEGRKGKKSRLRLALSAALGAFFHCVMLVWPVLPAFWEVAVTAVLVGALMWAAAFLDRPPAGELPLRIVLKFLKGTLVLWASSALLGGTLGFFRQFFWLSDWEALVISGAITWLLILGADVVLRAGARGNIRYPVRLTYKGRTKEFVALADSGNRLLEPESGCPVSVVSFKSLLGFCESVGAVTFIPYRAVGTERGTLPAVLFDKMEIFLDGRWREAKRPIVAITKEGLSSKGDFNFLLPEELILQVRN